MTSDLSHLESLDLKLSLEEKLLIIKTREIPYGKVTIVMRDGKPQYVESTVETYRLQP